MKIIVIGTRGIPDILGGVETHCEALYPRLVQLGINVTITRRKSYISSSNIRKIYKEVKLVDIFSPKLKSIEAFVHTFLAVIYAKQKRFKYIHIHAIGPSLVIPFARLLGIKVVMTHHGPDYDRQKWGKLAKASLKLGEWCAAKFANEIIVISNTINSLLKEKYKRFDAHLIPNGVTIPVLSNSEAYIKNLNLEAKKYIIAVGRFVPEKGFHDLIEAYLKSGVKEKLVLVGDSDHESTYSKSLKEMAINNGIVLTGFIKGENLNEIFSHAALFVMPSYHEGLPIALLEALSYNLNVLVSNIPANMEVNLKAERYFQVGNIEEMAEKISKMVSITKGYNYHDILTERYNWDTIAKQTEKVYQKLK